MKLDPTNRCFLGKKMSGCQRLRRIYKRNQIILPIKQTIYALVLKLAEVEKGVF